MAITSSFHPDEDTHVENVRYGKGSNAMGLLGSLLVDGGGGAPRWARWMGQAARHPDQVVRALWVRRWSERTVIGLVMQSLDNSLTVSGRPRRNGRGVTLTSRQGHGVPNPTWIPLGHRAIRRLAERLQARTNVPADPGGTIGDIADIPMTAHFLGGCVIGPTSERGVVDPYHRVHDYPGLHVVDGSADLGQPRSQPVADHHGSGRAGDGVVAQPVRPGSPTGAGLGLRPADAGRTGPAGRARGCSGRTAVADQQMTGR